MYWKNIVNMIKELWKAFPYLINIDPFFGKNDHLPKHDKELKRKKRTPFRPHISRQTNEERWRTKDPLPYCRLSVCSKRNKLVNACIPTSLFCTPIVFICVPRKNRVASSMSWCLVPEVRFNFKAVSSSGVMLLVPSVVVSPASLLQSIASLWNVETSMDRFDSIGRCIQQ